MQLEASTVINAAGLHSQKLNHQLNKFQKIKYLRTIIVRVIIIRFLAVKRHFPVLFTQPPNKLGSACILH